MTFRLSMTLSLNWGQSISAHIILNDIYVPRAAMEVDWILEKLRFLLIRSL